MERVIAPRSGRTTLTDKGLEAADPSSPLPQPAATTESAAQRHAKV